MRISIPFASFNYSPFYSKFHTWAHIARSYGDPHGNMHRAVHHNSFWGRGVRGELRSLGWEKCGGCTTERNNVIDFKNSELRDKSEKQNEIQTLKH